MLKKNIKSYLSKIKFGLGYNPKIESCQDWSRYIPRPYKSVLLLSADFEMAWAWRYSKSSENPLKRAIEKARIERHNVPLMLDLCDQYRIPVTWATIGHLFLHACSMMNEKPHSNLPRLDHFENAFWNFSGEDWFEYDPCSDLERDPEWYCPDLIKKIIDSQVDHEIACHTFSHIDCRDGVCTPDVLKAELTECKSLASLLGITLRSFVHPGHTIGNLDVLAAGGFTNFRTDYENLLGYPQKHGCGLWELKQTAELVFKESWSARYHVKRYCEIIRRAIKSRTVCVFWFHPSFDVKMIDEVLPEVFTFLRDNRNDIWITTHSEYVKFLDSKHE